MACDVRPRIAFRHLCVTRWACSIRRPARTSFGRQGGAPGQLRLASLKSPPASQNDLGFGS